MSIQQRDRLARRCLRKCYRTALGLHGIASMATSGSTDGLRLFYGGARAGDVGGPLVKLQRLNAYFPEHRWNYNLVYLLSNAPYLPDIALRILQRRRVPTVVNQNGVFYHGWYSGDWRAKNMEMAQAYHLADHVFWQSEFCRQAAERFLGEREKPGEILYNAVDTERFNPTTISVSESDFTFLITGKIDTHLFYRIEASLRGLAEARKQGLQARISIAGWLSPQARARSLDLADSLGIANEVSLTGTYTQDQAPTIYGTADAYLMLKHNDPCPNTVLEALSCGLPVLYSDSGGVPELVGEAAGVALPVEEDWDRPRWPAPGAVAEGMQRIVTDRISFAAAARERAVSHHDIQHWIDRHRAVFDRLLHGTG